MSDQARIVQVRPVCSASAKLLQIRAGYFNFQARAIIKLRYGIGPGCFRSGLCTSTITSGYFTIRAGYLPSGQDTPDQAKIHQIRPGYFRSGQDDNPCQTRICQIKPDVSEKEANSPGQPRMLGIRPGTSNQAMIMQIRPGYVRLGQMLLHN